MDLSSPFKSVRITCLKYTQNLYFCQNLLPSEYLFLTGTPPHNTKNDFLQGLYLAMKFLYYIQQ